MKKWIITVCLLLSIVAFSCACGNSQYVGTWEVTKAEVNGVTFDQDALVSHGLDNVDFTLEADGSGTFEWEETDYGIRDKTNNIDYYKEGNYLTWSTGDGTMYFEKQ